MPQRITVRPYEKNDDLAISDYCLPENLAIYTTLPRYIIEAFKKDIYNQPYVIFVGHDLVGCFALYTNYKGNIYTENKNAIIFKSFSIDFRYQRRGLAFKTLTLLPEIVKLHFPNKNEIMLTVHHTNLPAISLYIKAGFIDKGLRFAGDYGEEIIFHFDLIEEGEI